MKSLLLTLGLLLAINVKAHEMVPTYPEWSLGIYPGVLTTTMEIFNKRNDVEYYEIGVFDKDFEPIYFVADYKVFPLKYLSSISVDVYIAKENKDRVEYICSRSKIIKEDRSKTAVSSRICSRFRS